MKDGGDIGAIGLRFRDNGYLGSYFEPFDREGYTINIDHRVDIGRRKRHWQSEMQWVEDETMPKHGDAKFFVEGASFTLEKVSGRKRFDAGHGSDYVEDLFDDPYLEGCKYKPRREGNSIDKFERTSNVLRGGGREQPFRGYMDSRLVHGSDYVEELIDDRHVEGCKYKHTREVNSGNKFDRYSNVTRGGSHVLSILDCVDSLYSHLVDGSGHVEELIDDPHAKWRRFKQTRKMISGNKCNRTSNVIHGESHEQP